MADDLTAPGAYMVVGAYGGVGTEVVTRLRARGARLFLVGRDADKLRSLAERVNGDHHVADASSASEIAECVKVMKEKFGTIDGVACLTGSLFLKPAHLTSESDWNDVIGANLTASFNVVGAGAKAMMGSGGSIVLMSSAAARVGLPNHDALAAAKAGVEGLARSAAATYARHGVRVNCVAPGMLDTELNADLRKNAALLDAALGMYALPRMGTAQEVAGIIDWLLSADSGWVTGQTIVVDGGLSSVRGKARVSV